MMTTACLLSCIVLFGLSAMAILLLGIANADVSAAANTNLTVTVAMHTLLIAILALVGSFLFFTLDTTMTSL